MFRSKMFSNSGLWKSKNPHSLEYLKYLYTVLCKNQTVSENNCGLLVETLRSMSEILIWGDQNDDTVFDFFLEKNILSFFLQYMRQASGRFICVQLLQTLNILFENISKEASIYYLLSNNHINFIIRHEFDFSDEEVMAYYISFLKTLSLKLNKHVIHFFYNEHDKEFALYTEAIKFFSHSESMVRIAVRTITLNVFAVDDKAMLRYVTSVPYFSNLVTFIVEHILQIDSCVRGDVDHISRSHLDSLVAEHLDHMHYLSDILRLNIIPLNNVLCDNLLNRLFISLSIYSLTKKKAYSAAIDAKPHVTNVVALFLLTQFFLIFHYPPLVRQVADILLNQDFEILASAAAVERRSSRTMSSTHRLQTPSQIFLESSPLADDIDPDLSSCNPTNEEKICASPSFSLENRPFLETIFIALNIVENDYGCLYALGLILALCENPGVGDKLISDLHIPCLADKLDTPRYNVVLVDKLIQIICAAIEDGATIRLCTLQLAIRLLVRLVRSFSNGKGELASKCHIQDRHLAYIEGAKEHSMLLLRRHFKNDDLFLDMFEDEYHQVYDVELNLEFLLMDCTLLLPPTGTPLTGIALEKRLPCGEVERARQAIRFFFLLRQLSLRLRQAPDTQLPLSRKIDSLKIGNKLDLTNSDLISCTVTNLTSYASYASSPIKVDNLRSNPTLRKEYRFLVINNHQFILVEPDTKRLGWGIVTFCGYLQDTETWADKEDSKSLLVTVHPDASNRRALSYKLRFTFEDHIRCMAAKQRLTKGRCKVRQDKMIQVANLLDFPPTLTAALFSAAVEFENSGSNSSATTSVSTSRISNPVRGGGALGWSGSNSGVSIVQPTGHSLSTFSTSLKSDLRLNLSKDSLVVNSNDPEKAQEAETCLDFSNEPLPEDLFSYEK